MIPVYLLLRFFVITLLDGCLRVDEYQSVLGLELELGLRFIYLLIGGEVYMNIHTKTNIPVFVSANVASPISRDIPLEMHLILTHESSIHHH